MIQVRVFFISLLTCSALVFAETPSSDELVLSAESAQQAALQIQPLQAAPSAGEIQTFGMVVDLSPLIEIRQQWQMNRTQQDAARARQQASQQSLKRTEQLFQQDIISNRQLQEQRAISSQDQAVATSSRYQQETLLASARLQWGAKLTTWATQSNPASLEPWLQAKNQLIQITLPGSTSLPNGLKTIAIEPHGQRQHAVSASLIDSAPQIDQVTQGRRYFFKTENQHLPVASQLTVWIGDNQNGNNAVWLPESSVVWQQGQAWVFITKLPLHFTRIALNQPQRSGQGYIAGLPLTVGQSIVTQGAQTLLSQVLKSQNTHQDEDDD